MNNPALKPALPAWLEDAVFYEIYPQSYFDSNGDGIGESGGYPEQIGLHPILGVNAIWLNPCFASPFQDAGYDVADYYQVAPRYGSNDDLVRLFAEARRRGMRILLDLVAGHTSIQNPWFIESCKAERTSSAIGSSGTTARGPGANLVSMLFMATLTGTAIT